MSLCEQLTETATTGVAPALRAVDCLANETAVSSFGRLFGGGGALMPALTILLTLYVAFFALSLLTGRSRIGIAAFTPRIMTVGLVLTFITSWVAYREVVWNLAVGGPDQIAGVLMGTKGSATELFGSRIDTVFAAIAEIAEKAGAAPQGAAQQAGTFTPVSMMWLAAIMLLLGTVGVLVTARIALAVLLVLGPVFVVLALFKSTRGLFAGWIRGVVLTALAPLLAVLGGGFTLELTVPIIARLREADGIDASTVMALFLVAAVHVALMGMVLSLLGSMVSGWSVFGLVRTAESSTPSGSSASPSAPELPVATPLGPVAHSSRRTLGIANNMLVANTAPLQPALPGTMNTRVIQSAVTPVSAINAPSHGMPRHRARGIGSSYRSVSNRRPEILR